MTRRLPWTKFSWDAWDTDPALALCSMDAQGFWMRLLCICAKADGQLLIDGRKPSAQMLAHLTRQRVEDVERWIAELGEKGVYSRTRGGVIYSRRMRDDLEKQERSRAFGKRGGNPALVNKGKSNGGVNPPDKLETETETEREEENPLDPPVGGDEGQSPSGEADQPAEPKTTRRKPKCAIPDGYPDAAAIARQRERVIEAGANVDVAYHAQRFRNWALSKDARYADWERTLDNWIDREAKEAPRLVSAPVAKPADPWPGRLRSWRDSRYWNASDWGPKPGAPGCLVPAHHMPCPDLFTAPDQPQRGAAA